MNHLVTFRRPQFDSVIRRFVITQHGKEGITRWAVHEFFGWTYLIRKLDPNDPILNRANGIDWNFQFVLLV